MDGYIGEIKLFAGNFAPLNWAFCQGQLLPIAQNSALFSILGTTYGGNGQTNFALPDLRGRVAVGTGQGPGLSSINLGQHAGSENVTLTSPNLPAHNHPLNASTKTGTTGTATNNVPATAITTTNIPVKAYDSTQDTTMAPTGITGNGQPFGIRDPFLGLNYIICLEGLYPTRS